MTSWSWSSASSAASRYLKSDILWRYHLCSRDCQRRRKRSQQVTCYTAKAFLVPRLTKLLFLTGDLLTRAPQFGQLFFTYSKLSRRGGRLAAMDSRRIRKCNKTKNFVLKKHHPRYRSIFCLRLRVSGQFVSCNCPKLYLLDAHKPYAHRLKN